MRAGGTTLQVGSPTTDPGSTTITPDPPGSGGGGTTVNGTALLDDAAPVADAVQSAFPTLGSKLLVTAGALVALLVAGAVVRRAGGPLKARFDETLVESAQTTAMTGLTGAVGVLFVLLWGWLDELAFLLAQFDVQSDDVVFVVFTAVIVAGAYALTRLTKRAIGRLAREHGTITDHQERIFYHTVQVGIYVLALVVVFAMWGINVGGLLVGAGFAGIVLGLAARQTLGAVLAGFVVLLSRPFELGDWVVIDDREGIVSDVTIFNTQLRTFDDEYVMIPNDAVTDSEVVNRSRAGRLRLNLDVGVDYSTDVEEAVELAEEAMADHEVVLDQPEPQVVLSEFGDSAVVLRLRYYIDTPSARKMWKARTDVITDVKRTFDEAGVKIPFPQRELSGREETDGLRVDAASASASAPDAAANADAIEGSEEGSDDSAAADTAAEGRAE